MPTAMTGEHSKRKRTSAGDEPKKRRRSSSEGSEDPNAKILLMEQGILESRKNYNDITALLTMARDHQEGNSESMLATIALCRIFVRLLAQGSLITKKSLSEKDSVVVGWLRDHLSQYKSLLLSLLGDDDVAMTALTLCMRTLKAEGEYLYDKEEYTFPRTFLEEIIVKVLVQSNDEIVRAYIEEYAESYDDVRYYTFASIKYA
jgi:U3 small nucleolar RNA-associated protein 19